MLYLQDARGAGEGDYYHQGDDIAGNHVRSVVENGVDEGVCHRQTQEDVGHVLAPEDDAAEDVHDIARECADCDANDGSAGEKACQADCRVGDGVIHEHRLPGVRDAASQEILERAEYDAGSDAPARTAPEREDHERQHDRVHRAAGREESEFYIAESECHRDHYRALAQGHEP